MAIHKFEFHYFYQVKTICVLVFLKQDQLLEVLQVYKECSYTKKQLKIILTTCKRLRVQKISLAIVCQIIYINNHCKINEIYIIY